MPQGAGEVWSKEDIMEEDHIREQLRKLDIRKSTGPHGMHPQVLREAPNTQSCSPGL